MVRIQTRITQGLDLLSFFALRNWNFKSDNFQNIYKNCLTEEEHQMWVRSWNFKNWKFYDWNFRFFLDTVAVDDDVEYLKNSMLGGRQYILKEPLSTLPKARIQMKM